ncbi:redox-regulated molecular chaperone Hsp33, partial [Vibrio sp. Vb0599]|nr:redox-regulated molecular chaperone Hsp33 [Vibrio sp. Vb0599]MDW1956245.1 redox-regulated molecular chaperone Hsp33 [Vibrio sp. Vb0562]MDW1972314.1 redox-regulated molecular chaperone Hsp33 [Vibrio sp. 945]
MRNTRLNVSLMPTTQVRNAAQIKSSAETSLSSNTNKSRNYQRGKHSMANNVLNRYLFEDLSVRGELVQLDEAYQRVISSKEYPAA